MLCLYLQKIKSHLHHEEQSADIYRKSGNLLRSNLYLQIDPTPREQNDELLNLRGGNALTLRPEQVRKSACIVAFLQRSISFAFDLSK